MTTFSFQKPIEDIEDAVLLDTGWYPARVAKEPRTSPNEKLRDAVGDDASPKEMEKACEADEKRGFTSFIDLVVMSPDPEMNGRQLTIMLPFPSNADMKRRDRDGKVVYDAKMERFGEIYSAATGEEAEGNEITINVGMELQVYVKQQNKRGGKTLENRVDIFAGFRGIGEEEADFPDEEMDFEDN